MTVVESSVRSQESDVIASHTVIAFRWRILAIVADFFVLSVIESLANAIFGVTHVTGGSILPIAGGDIAMYTTTTDVGVVWLTAIMLVYFAGQELLFGTTVGKWLAGLRVTDLNGRMPHPVAVLARDIARLVDWLPLLYLVGGIAALGSPLRQRLGDRLARTVVVTRESLEAPLLSRTQLRWRLVLAGLIVVALAGYSASFFYFGRPPLVVQSAINTGALTFPDGMRSYILGAPHRGKGTATYPIHYQTKTNPRPCSGTVTLRWTGVPGGWQLADTSISCPQPSAPPAGS